MQCLILLMHMMSVIKKEMLLASPLMTNPLILMLYQIGAIK